MKNFCKKCGSKLVESERKITRNSYAHKILAFIYKEEINSLEGLVPYSRRLNVTLQELYLNLGKLAMLGYINIVDTNIDVVQKGIETLAMFYTKSIKETPVGKLLASYSYYDADFIEDNNDYSNIVWKDEETGRYIKYFFIANIVRSRGPAVEEIFREHITEFMYMVPEGVLEQVEGMMDREGIRIPWSE